MTLNSRRHPFVNTYRVMGKPSLSGAVLIELCAEVASSLHGDKQPTGLSEIVFPPAIAFAEGKPYDILVSAVRERRRSALPVDFSRGDKR